MPGGRERCPPVGAEVPVTRGQPRVGKGVALLSLPPGKEVEEAHAPCKPEAGRDGVSDSCATPVPREWNGGGAKDPLAYFLCRSPRGASAPRINRIAVSLISLS